MAQYYRNFIQLTCKHLVAICLKKSWSHFGLKPKGNPQVFLVRYGRYKKVRLVDSDNGGESYSAPEEVPEGEEESNIAETEVVKRRPRPKGTGLAKVYECTSPKAKKAKKPTKKSTSTISLRSQKQN